MASVACYIRVSTVGQNEAGQVAEIERWLRGNRVDGVTWYTDKQTGTNLNRPGFRKLQQAIFCGEHDTVVVYKLDRISRTLRDGLDTLCGWCDNGLRVVSVTQQIDFNGTVGKMIAAVLFAVAEMEQETRKERQTAGIAEARKRGVYTGRKAGTTKGQPARALELRKQGFRLTEIAAALNVSVPTVSRYLKDA